MSSPYQFSLTDKDYEEKVVATFAQENQKFLAKLIEILKVQEDDTILDLGCGWGSAIPILLKRVAKHGKVIGFDVNENFLAITERLFHQSIQTKKLELVLGKPNESLPFQNDSFDKIICHNVIENVIDKDSFLSECYRVLKPHGSLLLSHVDFDTAVYNSSYKNITRKLVHFFSDYTQHDWQATSDGQIGRKLKGLVSHSPFQVFETHALLLTEERYTQNHYGFRYSEWVVESVQKSDACKQHELDDWIDDLKNLDKDNSYYFSICVMAVLATK